VAAPNSRRGLRRKCLPHLGDTAPTLGVKPSKPGYLFTIAILAVRNITYHRQYFVISSGRRECNLHVGKRLTITLQIREYTVE
jgi:hypothetical protein